MTLTRSFRGSFGDYLDPEVNFGSLELKKKDWKGNRLCGGEDKVEKK